MWFGLGCLVVLYTVMNVLEEYSRSVFAGCNTMEAVCPD
jgi:hypothetical protein